MSDWSSRYIVDCPCEWCVEFAQSEEKKEENMSNVLILAKVDDKGNEIFSGAFTSESELLNALKNEVTLKIQNGTPIAVFNSNYVVKTMGLNVATPKAEATTFVSVNSESEWNKTYRVGVSGRKGINCTCPDYENRSKFNPLHVCKHMMRVTERPFLFGV